jgi:phospholipid/cholesterol/gamma-HCH transport system ATP-binding protein
MMPQHRRIRSDCSGTARGPVMRQCAGSGRIQPEMTTLPALSRADPTMNDASAPAVRLRDVRLERGGRAVLDGIDLEAPRGSIVAVLGPSGSGKSTLLAALTGELPPASGTVEVLGRPVPTRKRDLLELRKHVGVLLQGNGLLTDLTAADNVALPLRAHARLPRLLLERLVAMKLGAVGLHAAADLFPRELSGGMARRVALARALALEPRFLLLDEPFSGIDPIQVLELQRIIGDLKRAGIGILITDHNVRETLAVTDRAYIINNGKIFRAGTPEALGHDPDVKRVYLGESFRWEHPRDPIIQ